MDDDTNFRDVSAKPRSRCPNFTQQEVDRLVRLVEARSSVVLMVGTNKRIIEEKDRAWDDIAAEFNKGLIGGDKLRTATQLRFKLRNLKKRLQMSLKQSMGSSDNCDPFEDQTSCTDNSRYDSDGDTANDSTEPPRKPEFIPISPLPAPNASAPFRIIELPNVSAGLPANGSVAATDGALASIQVQHAVELQRLEMRHREEVHALRVKQMRALHVLRLKEARLKVRMLRKKMGDVESDSDDG